MKELDRSSIDFMDVMRKCPDCMEGGLLMGPIGGASINVKCDQCGSTFNICLWRNRIIAADRIPTDKSLSHLFGPGVLGMPQRGKDCPTEERNPQPYKIETLYAVIASQEKGEGICSMRCEIGELPMVTSSESALEIMKHRIKQVAVPDSAKIVVRKFKMVSEEEI